MASYRGYRKATTVAKALGISRRTMANWCKTDPALAFKKKGIYYIKLHELAKRPGLDLEAVRKLGESRWVRAVDAAKQYGIPERTLRHQCNQTPGLARRIGKNWYLNLDQWKCGT